jgi:hypothetical protein
MHVYEWWTDTGTLSEVRPDEAAPVRIDLGEISSRE